MLESHASLIFRLTSAAKSARPKERLKAHREMARQLGRPKKAPVARPIEALLSHQMVRHLARPVEGLKVPQMAINLADLVVRHLARPK
jgi:hypothetical protein